MQPEEEKLRIQLEAFQSEMSAPTQFKGKLNELLSQVRLQSQTRSISSGDQTKNFQVKKSFLLRPQVSWLIIANELISGQARSFYPTRFEDCPQAAAGWPTGIDLGDERRPCRPQHHIRGSKWGKGKKEQTVLRNKLIVPLYFPSMFSFYLRRNRQGGQIFRGLNSLENSNCTSASKIGELVWQRSKEKDQERLFIVR